MIIHSYLPQCLYRLYSSWKIVLFPSLCKGNQGYGCIVLEKICTINHVHWGHEDFGSSLENWWGSPSLCNIRTTVLNSLAIQSGVLGPTASELYQTLQIWISGCGAQESDPTRSPCDTFTCSRLTSTAQETVLLAKWKHRVKPGKQSNFQELK